MKTIRTDKAPAAIGPYSQAIKSGLFIFLSGQLPIDPVTGAVESRGVREQTRQIMENIKAILAEEGLGLGSVVKTTLFIRDMGTFAEINDVYGSYFGEHRPARSTVEVSRLPKDALIEIEAIASIER